APPPSPAAAPIVEVDPEPLARPAPSGDRSAARTSTPAFSPAPTSKRSAVSSFAIDLSPAVLASPGGLPAQAGVLLGARWMPGCFGASTLVYVPAFASHIDEPQGSADARVGIAGAGLVFEPCAWTLRPSIQAGLAGIWMVIPGKGRG